MKRIAGRGAHVRALDEASTATYATHERVTAIVQPRSAAEVARVVTKLAKARTPFYPVSGGKNWGYGSRVPPEDGCVLVDLSRMNRIVSFDRDAGLVTVEPGVSFRALARRLRSSPWMLSVPATTSAASVVGNALDRGVGAGMFADRFAHATAIEAVLADGTTVSTGPGHHAGPDLRGLFVQSSFGIVTRMTFELQRRPEAFALLSLDFDSIDGAARASRALLALKQAGALPTSWTIWNEYRRYAQIMQFPWGAAAPGELATIAPVLRERLGIAPWSAMVPIYGASTAHARAVVDLVKRAGGPHASRIARVRGDFSASPYLGWPDDQNVLSAYWRKKSRPRIASLDRDRCGVLWADAVVPVKPRATEGLVRAWERILAGAGFEPQIMIVFPWTRDAYVLALLLFDRDVAGEDARALACHAALLAAAEALGFGHARLATAAMKRFERSALAERVGAALDPSGVSSPGRYGRSITNRGRSTGASRASRAQRRSPR